MSNILMDLNRLDWLARHGNRSSVTDAEIQNMADELWVWRTTGAALKEEKASWRRVAERLEGERQDALRQLTSGNE